MKVAKAAAMIDLIVEVEVAAAGVETVVVGEEAEVVAEIRGQVVAEMVDVAVVATKQTHDGKKTPAVVTAVVAMEEEEMVDTVEAEDMVAVVDMLEKMQWVSMATTSRTVG